MFSRLDCRGLTVAYTFTDYETALKFFAMKLPKMYFPLLLPFVVETSGDWEYANIIQLTAAGVTDPVHYGLMLLHIPIAGNA